MEINDYGVYGYGQLAMLLRAAFADPRIKSVFKTDGLAFRIREIVTGVEKSCPRIDQGSHHVPRDESLHPASPLPWIYRSAPLITRSVMATFLRLLLSPFFCLLPPFPHMTSLFDLTGKTALVTGGSKGLGKAMARGFAEAGADVFISSRHEDELIAAAKEIGEGLERQGRVDGGRHDRPRAGQGPGR